jgi:phospholipid/cholesterol/gamma-HCH transport system substrate-binding protein
VITRQTQLQLLVFLLISAVGLSYTALRYAGLGKYFVDQGYVVSANFADSGGIFENAEVTYRGVPVGQVIDLELVPGGVQVDLQLRPGTQVPDDLKAVVRNRSAVGEQYVDLQPSRDGAPFLEAGDVIPLGSTDIPISPAELIVNLDDFVTSVDKADLAVTIDELGKAFDDGAGQSLQRIIDSGNALTRAAQDALPETKSLLRDGEIALNTQRDVGEQFKSFNRDLALLTDTLRSSDPDFRRLYANGTMSARETTELVDSLRSPLPILFDNLITLAQVQKVRLDALQQILVTYPNVVAGGFTVVPGDGTSHFGQQNNQDPPICRSGGYEATDERPPEDLTRRTPNLEAYCGEPDGSPVSVRGSRRSPYPPGETSFAEEQEARGGPSRGADEQRAASPSRTPVIDAEPIVLGDHDPRTGRVVTQDGRRYTIGSSAGASRVLGNDSWRWLLLGPLSS